MTEFEEFCDVNYTELDAEEDSYLIVEQTEDISTNWTGIGCQSESKLHRNFKSFAEYQRAIETKISFLTCRLHQSEQPMEETTSQNPQELFSMETLPFTVLLPSEEDSGPISVKDSSMKQLKKDIERDKLLINGTLLIGAVSGLDGALQLFRDTCELLLHQNNFPSIHRQTLDDFGKIIFQKVSRTFSGSVAFQKLREFTTNSQPPLNIHDEFAEEEQDEFLHTHPVEWLIVPQSGLAPPLTLRISCRWIIISNFSPEPQPSLQCEMLCSTIYQLTKGTESKTIRAEYNNISYLHIVGEDHQELLPSVHDRLSFKHNGEKIVFSTYR